MPGASPATAMVDKPVHATSTVAEPERTLSGLFWLLAFLLLGEDLTHRLGWPVPGAMIGMALLFIALCLLGRIPDSLVKASELLIGLLPLFVVPAGAAVLTQAAWGLNDLAALALAVPLSTLTGLLVAGLLARRGDR